MVDVNGLFETKPVEDAASRAWNYVAVGCGHDLQWWKEFFSVVRMQGYDDWVSLDAGIDRMAVYPLYSNVLAARRGDATRSN